MTTYEEAVRKILENIPVMNGENKPLMQCLGQVLAEDVYSPCDLPQTPVSGPDGYAVRSADIQGASPETPETLYIMATARAGHPTDAFLGAGSAIRIMTGSVIPDGADCVIRFEDTDEPADKNGPNRQNPDRVKIYARAGMGDNIRPVGSNVKKGELVIPGGTVIGPLQISALAAIGRSEIKVIRRPVVAVIATGDELIEPGERLERGRSYNCNSPAIASFVEYYGGRPMILGIARDRESSIISKIKKAMKADVIITSGGVSKGDYDLMRIVLAKLGEIVFSRLRMGPGAAVAFGILKNRKKEPVPVFSLAGPPMGCLVNIETLLRPALLKMMGMKDTDHPVVKATVTDSAPNGMHIPFVRYGSLSVTEGKIHVAINMAEKIGQLASIARSNAMAIIPEKGGVSAGDMIDILPLNRR
jgi:molybdopterin molybdotransferase